MYKLGMVAYIVILIPVQVGKESYCKFLAMPGYAATTRDHETLGLKIRKKIQKLSTNIEQNELIYTNH